MTDVRLGNDLFFSFLSFKKYTGRSSLALAAGLRRAVIGSLPKGYLANFLTFPSRDSSFFTLIKEVTRASNRMDCFCCNLHEVGNDFLMKCIDEERVRAGGRETHRRQSAIYVYK